MPATVTGAGRGAARQRRRGAPPTPAALAAGERCHAVVRPEKLRIEPAGDDAAPRTALPRVEGIVESSLYLGTSTQIVVDLGDGRADDRARPERRARPSGSRLPGGGARVELSWEPGAHARGPRVDPGDRTSEQRGKRSSRRRRARDNNERGSQMSSSEMRKSRASLIAAAVAALAAALGLAACGGGAAESKAAASNEVETVKLERQAVAAASRSRTGRSTSTKKRSRTSKRRPGSSVKYIEDINANEEFFAKMQPLLQQGRIRRPQHLRRHRLDGAARCTSSATCRTSTSRRCRTSKRTCCASLRHPPFDPNRDFSVPWQSGMTGIIVNKDLAPERALDLRPVRPASTRARSTCSPKCATRCRW